MTKHVNLQSSAITSVEIDENVVKVVYNSNTDKEYTFTATNPLYLKNNLQKSC